MWVKPIRLEGREVRVEPLSMEHAEALWQLVTPEIFTYLPTFPKDNTFEAFQEYIKRTIENPTRLQFAIVLMGKGEAVGTTSYMEIRPEDRGLEIGNTWISKPFQGGPVNPENKYLLLRHAFETLGAVRVQLKTDGRNLQSQHAIEKLGARKEGILRKHLIMPDGFVRDTAMYSIIAEEWPDVKAALEGRLGYVP